MYRQGSPEIVAQILGLRLPDLRELGIRHGRGTCGGRSISGVALSLNALDGRARRREWRTTRAAREVARERSLSVILAWDRDAVCVSPGFRLEREDQKVEPWMAFRPSTYPARVGARPQLLGFCRDPAESTEEISSSR